MRPPEGASSAGGASHQPGAAASDIAGVPAALEVRVERRSEKKPALWYATIDDDTFLVGGDVKDPYHPTRRGLMTRSMSGLPVYSADDWREEFGVWADMMEVTDRMFQTQTS
jgi:hypothetical protein